jgi:hypothetical protein
MFGVYIAESVQVENIFEFHSIEVGGNLQRITDKVLYDRVLLYTVDIFSGEPDESAQLGFALKNFGRFSSDFLPIWANFVHCSAEEFVDLGKFRSNRKKFVEIFGAKLNCTDSPISGEKNN